MTRSKNQQEAEFSPEETEQRLQKLLRGAFAGPPTPFKDIPLHDGKPRAVKRTKPKIRKAS